MNEQSPWIDHGPSKPCPFASPYSSQVDIRLRDGTEKLRELACNTMWFWYEHDKHDYDVVAYRVPAPDAKTQMSAVRCQCCQAEHPADSYSAGFIAGSGMCQACDAAMPPKDLPIGEVEIPTIVATFDGLYLVPTQPLKRGDHLMTVAQHNRIVAALSAQQSAPERVSVPVELLELLRNFTLQHDSGVAGVLRGNIDALLASHAEGGEV